MIVRENLATWPRRIEIQPGDALIGRPSLSKSVPCIQLVVEPLLARQSAGELSAWQSIKQTDNANRNRGRLDAVDYATGDRRPPPCQIPG